MAAISSHGRSPKGGVRELNNTRPCLMSQVKQLFTHVQNKFNQTPAKRKPPLHRLVSCGYGHQRYEKKPTLRWMEAVFLCRSRQHNENALRVAARMRLRTTPFPFLWEPLCWIRNHDSKSAFSERQTAKQTGWDMRRKGLEWR